MGSTARPAAAELKGSSILSFVPSSGDSFVAGVSNAALRRLIQSTTLEAWGLPPGARIAFYLPNGPMSATALVAFAYRYCVVPCGPADRVDYVTSRIQSARCVALVTLAGSEQEAGARAAAAAANVPVVSIVAKSERGEFALPPSPPNAPAATGSTPPLDPDAICLILHTSGTTGASKRVPYSMRRLLCAGEKLAAALGLKKGETGLNMMPLHHVGGITTCIFAPLVAGCRMIFAPRFDASDWFDAIDGPDRVSWFASLPHSHRRPDWKDDQRAQAAASLLPFLA